LRLAQSFLHERFIARLVDQMIHLPQYYNAMSKFRQDGSSIPRSMPRKSNMAR
jgi:hypothetical protein